MNEIEKNVVLSLNTAKEMYNSGVSSLKNFALDNFTKEELEQLMLPTDWKDITKGGIKGFFPGIVGKVCEINVPSTDRNKNDYSIFPTKEEAEAVSALAKLCHLRDAYNEDWKPNWNNGKQNKCCLGFLKDEIYLHYEFSQKRVLYFKNRKIAKLFAENFKDLLEQAKPLL